MRTYAVLHPKHQSGIAVTPDDINKYTIIYRDSSDPRDHWYIFQTDVSRDNADVIIEALNREEHNG